MKRYIVITIALLFTFSSYSQRKYVKPKFANNWSKPSKHPDHIVLNFSQNPATSISITWRTSEDIKVGFGEIAISDANPKFIDQAITKKAITKNLNYSNFISLYNSREPEKSTFSSLNHNYHSVTFQSLEPNTIYAY